MGGRGRRVRGRLTGLGRTRALGANPAHREGITARSSHRALRGDPRARTLRGTRHPARQAPPSGASVPRARVRVLRRAICARRRPGRSGARALGAIIRVPMDGLDEFG